MVCCHPFQRKPQSHSTATAYWGPSLEASVQRLCCTKMLHNPNQRLKSSTIQIAASKQHVPEPFLFIPNLKASDIPPNSDRHILSAKKHRFHTSESKDLLDMPAMCFCTLSSGCHWKQWKKQLASNPWSQGLSKLHQNAICLRIPIV